MSGHSLSSAVSELKSSSVVLFELLFLDSEESVLSSSLSDFESEDFVLPPFALAAASFAELITISRPRFAADEPTRYHQRYQQFRHHLRIQEHAQAL